MKAMPNERPEALVPVVVRALDAWESLPLEIGELAVVCGDGLFAEVLGTTARTLAVSAML